METCLLGHGLSSISNEMIGEIWPDLRIELAWVEEGKVKISTLENFLKIRSKSRRFRRYNGLEIERGDYQDYGFLTASGTMAVAKKEGFRIVVSCGIGGISDIKAEPICYDLNAITDYNVPLIATAFKDMIDYKKTFDWLREHGALSYGVGTSVTDGYLFNKKHEPLDGQLDSSPSSLPNLILNPIPNSKRLKDISILEEGMLAGIRAEERGDYYHPAANAYFDNASEGYSSIIQLESIRDNIDLAKKIIKQYN